MPLKKVITILVIILSNQHFSWCQEYEEHEELICIHVNNSKWDKINHKTVSPNFDISHLKSIRFWNNANDDLENIERKTIHFDKIFTEEKLEFLVFKLKEEKMLNLKKILPRKLLKRRAKTRISKPVILEGIDSNRYGIIYTETSVGPENGSGGIKVYMKKESIWVEFFSISLWIS